MGAPTPTKSSSRGINESSKSSSNDSSLLHVLYALIVVGSLQLIYLAGQEAYNIRLYAVNEYGRIIHEFDPYFNLRATVYLYEHGWKAFSTWFDYLVWYPLGRPVGTTIYPGMQVTAVALKRYWLTDWSINDVCVMMPAWFGVTATLGVAALTYVCCLDTGMVIQDIKGLNVFYDVLIRPIMQVAYKFSCRFVSPSAVGLSSNNKQPDALAPLLSAAAAAVIMSVLPAHLLRSVAGGYDNESIAMTAMVVTFFAWTASLRPTTVQGSFLSGIFTGVAYFYMVAAWGGYVFVINLIAAHAGSLVLLGRYSQRLWAAYSAFYVTGTFLAIQVPVVGWTPLKSLEQMAPLIGFGGLQLLEIVEMGKRRYKWSRKETWKARMVLFGGTTLVAMMIAAALASTGFFGPISSRVRGLFVKHTKTGNPLVDSVAEHQAANSQAYSQYLHNVRFLLPIGMAWTLMLGFGDSSSFLVVYAAAAYYFSLRMVRLILLTAPIASCLGGIAVGHIASYGINAVLQWYDDAPARESAAEADRKKSKGKKKQATKKKDTREDEGVEHQGGSSRFVIGLVFRLLRVGGLAALLFHYKGEAKSFHERSHELARSISHPTIVQKGTTSNGDVVLVDDYREAYQWLAENTPEDARIMAWWDYGYQISGIGNRTTIADGNTWNHEHIALLGRILTAPEKEAHRIARHLADYVLVWAGGGGDDLAKSPHLRRIANSVYRGLCREPTCKEFGFYADRTPTETMQGCLLRKLHSNGLAEGVEVDRNRFREVFRTKYRKVRIYKILSVSKESKEWVVQNRKCDAPGSWYCPGSYPPALNAVLEQKSDFAQLEDFNRGAADEEYTKEYLDNLNKRGAPPEESAAPKKTKLKKLGPETIEKINAKWEDNTVTTRMWEAIASNDGAALRALFVEDPTAPHRRSKDGRGPMWWAHEHGRTKMVDVLKRLGVSEELKDINGLAPLDVNK